jgi:2-hydroxychromene-2-carboxylate isomerase
MRLEFFFDFSCPFAYLAATQIESLSHRNRADLTWKPMLLGGVFRAVETPQNLAAALPPSKARRNGRDMFRWADHLGVELRMPAGHPMRTVRALRTLLALPDHHWPPLIHEIYRLYWREGRNIADPATIEAALDVLDLNDATRRRALGANDDPAIKDELRRRTDEAIERGVFGAPATFVSGGDLEAPEMLYGVDRLEMVEAVLQGWRPSQESAPASAPPPDYPVGQERTIDFWYDFSSPFAYLGSTQVRAIAERSGATLRYRPLLLGALFKEIGTPNVPLMAMSESKRAWMGRDLGLWSKYWQVPFVFSSHFPLRTVAPLRAALAAGPEIATATHAIFEAAWVRDRNIADPAVLQAVLGEAGLDGAALVERTQAPPVKAQLFANTTEAKELGVFGVPSLVVRAGAGPRLLFWGQDRLALAEKALAGWIPPQELKGL